MRYAVPTLSIIFSMDCATCYTPIEAARLYFSSQVGRSRRRLRSLTINHSFDGYRRRKNESLERYRLRLKDEYGPLSTYIRFEIKFGRNGKRYKAYSGCIFKLAVEPYELHVAALAFCHVLLVANYQQPPRYLHPDHNLSVEFRDAHTLLHEHFRLYGNDDQSKVDWLNLIPARAFDAAIMWATGRHCPVMALEPPKPLRTIFLARLKQGFPWSFRNKQTPRQNTCTIDTKPCVALAPVKKAALPATTVKPRQPPKKADRKKKASPTRKPVKLLSFAILLLTVGVVSFSVLREPTLKDKSPDKAVVLPTSKVFFPDGERLKIACRKTRIFEAPVIPTVEQLSPPAP